MYINLPRFLYAEIRTHLLESFKNDNNIYDKFPYFYASDDSSAIYIMISTHDFRIAQLVVSFDFSTKKLENLFAKNCLETSLEMLGKCLIAYFLTLTLESSPRDNISNPINC